TAWNGGSVAFSFELWMTTISLCGSALNPAWLRIWSARCDSPTLVSWLDMVFMPMFMPTASETTTNASQPKTAVFQWLALQRPMRAAMLFERFKGDIAWAPSEWG